MEKYINQILENNNRVIVPDFGAFIVKQRKPLTIVFNEFLQYNDGMLVDTVSKSEDLDREQAKEKIDEFVKSIVAKLDGGEKYPLEKLGVLIKNTAGKISLGGEESEAMAKPKPAAKTTRKVAAKEVKPSSTQAKKGKASPAKTEDDKKSKAEAEKKAQEEKLKAEQEKKEKEEQEKKAKEDQVKKAKEEQAKKAQEEKLKAEEEKKANEAKAKADEEKKQQTEKARLERERKAQEQMKVKETEKSSAAQTAKSYSYQSTVTNNESQNKKRNIILWVIIIVLINGILITGYFMYNKDLPAFFKKSDTEELLMEEPVLEEDNYVTESYEEAVDPVEVEEPTVEEEIITEEIMEQAPVTAIAGTKYYVVAGAFSIEQNADNLVLELRKKGYNAEKFTKIGSLHAVSYDVFSTKAEADKLLEKIQSNVDSQAWIKRID